MDTEITEKMCRQLHETFPEIECCWCGLKFIVYLWAWKSRGVDCPMCGAHHVHIGHAQLQLT
jgi:ribosomal protein S27E